MRKRRVPVLVFDPCCPREGDGAGGWPGYVFTDWQRFSKAFWANSGAFVVIDEAADVFEQNPADGRQMLRRGRHGGRCVCLVSQRYIGLDKTARDQASDLYAFGLPPSDAKMLADEFRCPALLRCSELQPLHYIFKKRLENRAYFGKLNPDTANFAPH